MGMKLLPKSEVEKARAADKQREINEGSKLAKKIDNLREVVVEEEEALELFRKETIKRIYEEITVEAQKRDNLKKEVTDLETRKRIALEPLDQQWGELKEAQRSFEEVKTQHLSWADTVGQREVAIGNREQGAQELLTRAQLANAICDARLLETGEAQNKAKLALEAAENIKGDAVRVKEEVESYLTSRETNVAVREASVTMKESLIEKSKKRIAAGWRLLNDRKAAFYRDIKSRIK